MQDVDRFRRPQQLCLFEPPKILPTWRNLPLDTRRKVTQLLAKLLEDYSRLSNTEKQRGESDE